MRTRVERGHPGSRERFGIAIQRFEEDARGPHRACGRLPSRRQHTPPAGIIGAQRGPAMASSEGATCGASPI